ncbi:hypothetical protein LU631_22350 [Erwinia tracheiphila]|uniref:Uncharacterized protein n=1 Tax=Erwinia tracheiphila TaxID=65700 RepID=A0A0M2KGN3_9GAMM|nr:hypothetical protein [Erwinia tracheiphila]EOS94932.1 hypothetical protein ETR_11067 [Erwinia tracheiphila PSU-1]KKF36096.1 hypothetical protein SY86_12745 [Erwinia tracheiphila]UIA87415.1 hypothetical protein LU631_22350 [Erwinia tracheiphila]UIA95780.1 hypothetical protein LU633_20795 [Erwinia tracheiphila]
MKNNDDDKLCDILIGEAVMELLARDEAISWGSLLGKLRAALDVGDVEVRIVEMAIKEVKAGMASRGTSGSISLDNSGTILRLSGATGSPTRH